MAYMSAFDAFNSFHAGNFTTVLASNVSDHFTWGEVFIRCTQAEILIEPLEIWVNAQNHAQQTMDPIRRLFDRAVIVHVWFRGNKVHDRAGGKTHDISVGGTGNGYHPKGEATDFEVEGVSPSLVHIRLNRAAFMAQKGLEDPVYKGTHVDSRKTGPFRFGPNH
jgi:hypothetical protein